MTQVFVWTFQDVFGLIAAVGIIICYAYVMTLQWWRNRKAKK